MVVIRNTDHLHASNSSFFQFSLQVSSYNTTRATIFLSRIVLWFELAYADDDRCPSMDTLFATEICHICRYDAPLHMIFRDSCLSSCMNFYKENKNKN
jgi:hypothetical protein